MATSSNSIAGSAAASTVASATPSSPKESISACPAKRRASQRAISQPKLIVTGVQAMPVFASFARARGGPAVAIRRAASGDARELGGSGIAERARLRIGEQAEQAIVIGDERDRIVDCARRASREGGRFARRGRLVEGERDPAQIVDGDDVERSRRHRAVPGYEGVGTLSG